MSDRNGDGLPVLAAVKADRFRSHQLAATLALSRRKPRLEEQQAGAEAEQEPLDEPEHGVGADADPDPADLEHEDVTPDEPADINEGEEGA
jgi:hypothetical protein